MRPLRTIAALTASAALILTMAACSSSSDTSTSTPAAGASASVPPIASDPAGAIGESGDPATAAAQAACDQIVADKLTQADAEALVKDAGLESRIGSVDGKPNALTMDYNASRVTFTVDGGVVTECIVG